MDCFVGWASVSRTCGHEVVRRMVLGVNIQFAKQSFIIHTAVIDCERRPSCPERVVENFLHYFAKAESGLW